MVKSQSSSNMAYHISFQGSPCGLPSCSCADWQLHHLPCKHFLAVFRHFENWGWNSLPSDYVTSPYLSLDPCCVTMGATEDRQPSHMDISEDDNTGEIESEANTSQLPLPSKARLGRARNSVGNLCAILRDYSYKCQDTGLLELTAKALTDVISKVKSALPQTEEFVIEDGPMTQQRQKRKGSRPRGAPLPKRRRKKKWTGRHGVTAEKQRAASSVSSIEELHCHDKGNFWGFFS